MRLYRRCRQLPHVVIAQYTGVSLQRDLACWETYSGGTWTAGPANYAALVSASPDDTRMRTTRRSFHIRAINSAVIQEVSVFAIGQSIHHWCRTLVSSQSPTRTATTGSSALAEGYRGAELTGNDADNSAFPQDRGWAVERIRRATDLSEETNNIRRIYLGEISAGIANNATNIDLEAAIGSADDEDNSRTCCGRTATPPRRFQGLDREPGWR